MESLYRARTHPQNQEPEQQRAIKLARQILIDFNVVDPGPKTPAVSEDLQLQSVVREYNAKPHTSELVTNFWQTFLETLIKTLGLNILVPIIVCDRTPEELEVLKKDGRMWIPETKLTYAQLDKIFPKMGSHVLQQDRLIRDKFQQNAKGVDVEASIDSLNRKTEEKDLEELFKSQGRKGMRLSTFILTSQASKLLTNQYLDEGTTWSRLLGTRYGGFVVNANFKSDGLLRVGWDLRPQAREPGLGGRSEGIKKT